MPHEDRRAVLERQDSPRRSHGFIQGRQRILHRSHVEAGGLQARDDLGPGRAVGEQPMHEDNVLGAEARESSRYASGGKGRSACRHAETEGAPIHH